MNNLRVKGEGRREKGELTATGLEGRVCVITGAARGIGRALAERLLAAGARVVLSDRGEEVSTGVHLRRIRLCSAGEF